MATTYDQLRHSVMLLANMLTGSQPATLQTAYQVSPLTSTQNKSADFAFDFLREAILQGEQDFVSAVAFTGNHPWRTAIRGVTSGLATGAVLPTSSSGAKPIVGIFGAVYDSNDNTPCVEMPLDVIVRRVRNANTHYVTPVYYYKMDGNIIYHTRALVQIECCVYLRADQVTAYNAAGNMLLPDLAESGIVARVLSRMFRDSLFMNQAAVWRQYSDDALAVIRGGGTNVTTRSVPVPVTLAKAG